MEDIEIAVKGFWLPDEVAVLAGVAGLECSTADDVVIVHPRPRVLTVAEIEVLKKALGKVKKPGAAVRMEELAAAVKAVEAARQAKMAAFRAKADGGKVTLADVVSVLLAMMEE